MKRLLLALACVLALASPSLAETFNAKSHNVVGDGIADDTAAIQATVNDACAWRGSSGASGATVRVEAGFYKLTATIVVCPDSLFRTVNIIGDGSLATRFRWYGPADGVAFRVNGLKQYTFDGWLLENMTPRGTTTGILMQRDTGTGCQSGNTTWRQIRVAGFGTGVHIGNASIAQSACGGLFEYLTVQANDTGIVIEDGNSLTFAFTMLGMAGNGTGMLVLSGGVVSVLGGDVGHNTVTDFDLRVASPYTITNVRSEHSNRFIIAGNSSGGVATTLTGNQVVAAENPDGYCIVYKQGPLVLMGNQLWCKVFVSGNTWGSTTAIGNAIADDTGQPFHVEGTGGRYYQFGNRKVRINYDGQDHFPDEMGVVVNGVRVPWLKGPPPAP